MIANIRVSGFRVLKRKIIASPKASKDSADVYFMVNPVSSANATYSNETVKPVSTAKSQSQPSSSQPSDTVTLKSVGEADQDGNNH